MKKVLSLIPIFVLFLITAVSALVASFTTKMAKSDAPEPFLQYLPLKLISEFSEIKL